MEISPGFVEVKLCVLLPEEVAFTLALVRLAVREADPSVICLSDPTVCPLRTTASRYGSGKYPTLESLVRHFHHCDAFPRGSDLERTATRSPFLTSSSTAGFSGVKSYRTRQK